MRCVPAAVVVTLLCGIASPARAASMEYALSVDDGLPATFAVPFHADYAGTMTIETSWRGTRLLFFGVDGADGVAIAHRSGPSPQRLDIAVDAVRLARGGDFKLTIKALPSRGALDGTVRITVPDSPEVVAQREALLHPPPPPPPPSPAWTLPARAPAGAAAAVNDVFEAVETYRSAVTAESARSDDCAWQELFLRYAAGVRDRLGAGGAAADTPSLRYFALLSTAVRQVDGLRASNDPVLAGPVPSDRLERRDWLIARSEQIRPIERRLDQLGELLRGGHAPALESEVWIPRFVACLTGCERYFDERVRLADDDAAPSAALAEAQWSRILAAARVFDTLAAFRSEPEAP